MTSSNLPPEGPFGPLAPPPPPPHQPLGPSPRAESPPPPPYPPRAPGAWWRPLGGLAALILAIGGVAAVGAALGHQYWHSPAPVAYAPANGGSSTTNPCFSGGFFNGRFSACFGNSSILPGAGSPSDVSSIAAKVDPALVDINSSFSYQSASGAATGIVVSSNGEVLTNNHVIEGATSITATDIGNGKTYTAIVVGYDPNHDIAVLRLDGASGLQTAQFANSSSVTVGEGVVGIGNAGGAGGTPVAAGGAVTALNQSIAASDELSDSTEYLHQLIEVNAGIQSGDSGGALVNAQGQVIGMDTAATQSFVFSSGGQGYAIPIDQVLATAAQAERGQGTATLHVGPTAFLGITVSSSSAAGGLGAASGSGPGGVTISSVVNGEPAQKAGLGPNDIITSIDGQAVGSYGQLVDVMLPHHPGDSVSVGYTTPAGVTQTVQVTLASGPAT